MVFVIFKEVAFRNGDVSALLRCEKTTSCAQIWPLKMF